MMRYEQAFTNSQHCTVHMQSNTHTHPGCGATDTLHGQQDGSKEDDETEEEEEDSEGQRQHTIRRWSNQRKTVIFLMELLQK